ncbi:MAG: hypothetical protein Q4E37_01305 [Tissierellia bacterium]|nr:hypothetical protein [Tissierellia bacterium]
MKGKRASLSLLMIFIFFILTISILSLLSILDKKLKIGLNHLDADQASYYAESLAYLYYEDPSLKEWVKEVYKRPLDGDPYPLPAKAFGEGEVKEAFLSRSRDREGKSQFHLKTDYSYRDLGGQCDLVFGAFKPVFYPEDGLLEPQDPKTRALLVSLGEKLSQEIPLPSQFIKQTLRLEGESLLRPGPPPGYGLEFYKKESLPREDEEGPLEEGPPLEEGEGQDLEDPWPSQDPEAAYGLSIYGQADKRIPFQAIVTGQLEVQGPLTMKGILYLGPGASLEGDLSLEGVLFLDEGSQVQETVEVRGLIIDLSGQAGACPRVLYPPHIENYLFLFEDFYGPHPLRSRKNV